MKKTNKPKDIQNAILETDLDTGLSKTECDYSEKNKGMHRKFKIVLVASDYVVFDVGNGTNGFIEKINLINRCPAIDDIIEI